MKNSKKFFTFLFALLFAFATLGLSANALPVPDDEEFYLEEGIHDFYLSDIPDEDVRANYDEETNVLTISGSGHIKRVLWFNLVNRSTNFNLYYSQNETKIVFEDDGNKYLPQDSSFFFFGFGGDIIGLDNLNTDNVVDMSYMFAHTKAFNREINFNTSSAEYLSYMFYASNYSKDIVFDITSAVDIINFAKLSNIENVTFNNAVSLAGNRIYTDGLESITVNELQAGNTLSSNSGKYLVERFDGQAWNNYHNLYQNNNRVIQDGEEGDFKITRNNYTDIETYDISLDTSGIYASDLFSYDIDDSGSVKLLTERMNLKLYKDDLILDNTSDYVVLGASALYSDLDYSENGGIKVEFVVNGISNACSGSRSFEILFPFENIISGEPEVEEVSSEGIRLSDVSLNIGTLTAPNGNIEVYWFSNFGLGTDFIVEQGKAYWYYAYVPEINSNYGRFGKIVPWPSDTEPEPEVVAVGGDIIPVFIAEVPDEKIPQATPSFEDVSEDSEYFEAVEFVKEKGIIEGIGNGKFAPEILATRAMVATVLYRMAGMPEVSANQTLSDVMPEDWFYTPVRWGVEQGVIEGYDDGSFKPDVKLTKEQIIAMLHRYASNKEGMNMDSDFDITGLQGYDMLEPYAVDAMKWAYKQGIVEGDKICPKKEVKRGELAEMIMKFMKK